MAGRVALDALHAVLLVLTMLPVVLLSKKLAVFDDYGVETMGAPAALGGLIVATLVLAPEGLGALHAALTNRLQRSVNILLGSALATISLTVPAVLMIGLLTGRSVELGLDPVEMIMLLLTLAVSTLTFTGGRSNILQGAIHLAPFLTYIVLIFNLRGVFNRRHEIDRTGMHEQRARRCAEAPGAGCHRCCVKGRGALSQGEPQPFGYRDKILLETGTGVAL